MKKFIASLILALSVVTLALAQNAPRYFTPGSVTQPGFTAFGHTSRGLYWDATANDVVLLGIASTASSVPATSITGVLPIANGGTNASSFTAPQSAVIITGTVNCGAYFDGTKIATDTVCEDFGYDVANGIFHSERVHIHSAQTLVAQFLNTGAQSTTGGAGIAGYADPTAAILSGNREGFFLFGASVDAAHTLVQNAGMLGYATENQSATNQGARVEIVTTPNGSTTAARRTVATFGQDAVTTLSGGLVMGTAATQIQARAGSAAVPGYTFVANTGTGFFNAVANNIEITQGGTSGYIIAGTMFGPSTDGGRALGQIGNTWSELYLTATNTATVGAVTINNVAGRVNVAAGATSVVVTDSLALASSQIFATAAANDATCYVKNVVAAAGSFTINMTAACTANTAVNFFLLNPA